MPAPYRAKCAPGSHLQLFSLFSLFRLFRSSLTLPNVSDTLQNCGRRCSAVPWTLPFAIAVAESPGRPLQLPCRG
eukprot:scaffold12868_cov32-Phaeocystis_antarctica.AAC.1